MLSLSNAAKVLMLGSFLVLGGCAQKLFVKAGASTQDFTTDRYSCERDSRQSGGFGTGLVGAMQVQEYFNRCMSAHGWNLQDKEQIDAATRQAGQENSDRLRIRDAKISDIKSRVDEVAGRSMSCIADIQNIPNYKTISQHFSKIGEYTLTQKSDGNLATISESKIYLDYVEHIQTCITQRVNGLSEIVPDAAVIFKENANNANDISARLIRREISWGSAAVLQEKSNAESKEKLRKIPLPVSHKPPPLPG